MPTDLAIVVGEAVGKGIVDGLSEADAIVWGILWAVKTSRADSRRFADVWSVQVTGDAIYFGSYQGLYRWSPRQNSMRVW